MRFKIIFCPVVRSPTQTHGLGDTFLREFLNIIAQKCGDKNRFDNVLISGKPIQADILLLEN
jgi:hypothetical protein